MNLKPKKSLGQNFLVDQNYQRKILAALQAINPDQKNPVLEIGPGHGALTQHLVASGFEVTLIEKDTTLPAELVEKFPALENRIVTADFLKADLSFLDSIDKGCQWVGIGNLPYNVASQIFIRIIENRRHFSHLLFMFQKEMALRFVAKPSTKDYGLLTLWAQIYTQPKILFHLPPSVFFPPPKIDFSFVHFALREKPLIEESEEDFFWKVMRALFQQRRKMIRSSLKSVGQSHFEKLSGDVLEKRPENLGPEELIALVRAIAAPS